MCTAAKPRIHRGATGGGVNSDIKIKRRYKKGFEVEGECSFKFYGIWLITEFTLI